MFITFSLVFEHVLFKILDMQYIMWHIMSFHSVKITPCEDISFIQCFNENVKNVLIQLLLYQFLQRSARIGQNERFPP